jgi:hypothetical protein
VLTQVSSVIGADIYYTSQLSPQFLNEGEIVAFIKEQNAIDNAITSYSFASVELQELMKKIAQHDD